jgi:hypothetical protein
LTITRKNKPGGMIFSCKKKPDKQLDDQKLEELIIEWNKEIGKYHVEKQMMEVTFLFM